MSIYLNISDHNNYDELTGRMLFHSMDNALAAIRDYIKRHHPKYLNRLDKDPMSVVSSLNANLQFEDCHIELQDLDKLNFEDEEIK